MTDRVDTCIRADGAIGTPSDGGSAWVVQSGTWSISSNKAGCDSTASASCVLESSVASNVYIEATFAFINAVNGLVLRSADDNNYILGQVINANSIFISERVSGSFNTVASVGSLTFSHGDVIKFAVGASNDFTVYVNGVSKLTGSTSNGASNTKHGLYTNGDNSSRFTSITIVGAGASATTLSGPSSGMVNVASSNFTAGANGPITGTVVCTPTDSSGNGSFSPTTVSISSGSPTGTFTYTPTTTGARNINITNDGSLTAPSDVAYTSNAGAASGHARFMNLLGVA